jgi:hypothetical protein
MLLRIVRPALLVVLVLTFAGAAWQIVQLERELDVRSLADASTARAATECRAAMLDLRAVQRAYTAPGQDSRYWRSRAAADATRLDACVGALVARLESAQATATAAKLRAARVAVQRNDTRMADLAGTGLRDHAHDLLYGDAIGASVAFERELGAAEQALGPGAAGSGAAVRASQMTAALAACGVALLTAILLFRLPRASDAASPADDAIETPAAEADAASEPVRLGERAASPAALQAAADVCGALARVQQPQELAGLIERIHGVLDSRGTIVWVYDAASASLRPGLSAGYAPTAIGRMGAISLSSETPVASAFRRGEARSVRGTHDAPGALVVPIVAAGGVAGVVTLELPPGNDRQPATLALTRVFAAQLAGLLSVDVRPAEVGGPEIVMPAPAARAAATGDAERAAGTGRFVDLG